MLFGQYCEYLAKIESEASRTELTKLLAELMSKLGQAEIAACLYLLKGRVAADYLPIELNFSDRSFLAALTNAASIQGLAFDAVARFGELGDSGKVATEFLELSQVNSPPSLLSNIAVKSLQINDVFYEITKIANTSGSGASKQKQRIAIDTLLTLTPVEGRYFAKMVTGSLRLGISNKTILDAISWAKTGSKSLRTQLDRAYGIRADIGQLAELVLFQGVDLDSLSLEPGVPVAAQLVEREADAAACIARIPNAIVQPKYDGLRAQLHLVKGANDQLDSEVRIFSRNMEPLTDMFPDLIEVFQQQDLQSIVLDGEIIGVDESTGTFLPFQETSQRRRKYNVAETSTAIPIKYFIFDLLYLNGEDITAKPLSERLQVLHSLKFVDPQKKLEFTESLLFTDAEALDAHFRQQLDKGLEGVIVKNPQSIYSPGKRGFDWIKLKANTFADLKDTVDCVIMGYYFGQGNRAKFGIGGFLMGIYNAEQNVYQTLAKVGSGVKDDQWAQFKNSLDQVKLPELPKFYQICRELMPDVLVAPEIVAEIDADEISLSKFHTAGQNSGQNSEQVEVQGFSLRFPRLKIFGRDKSAQDTTTVLELRRLYELGRK